MNFQSKNVLVIGATSAIAQSVIHLLAQRKCQFFLLARNLSKLTIVVNDITTRYQVKVEASSLDFFKLQDYQKMLQNVILALGSIDLALIAHGSLPDQKEAERDINKAQDTFFINFTSVAIFSLLLAEYFENTGQGTLAMIGSIAGDRGRKSNYIYGSSKGALNVFVDGLRGRVSGKQINVILIKPGFVDTPMTSQLNKNFLFSNSNKIAAGIVKAIDKKRETIYLPYFWRFISWTIRLIPDRIFNKLNI